MPKRKGDGENPSLANEEVSLKEKYALLRAQKQDKEKDEKAKLEREKMEHARKVLAATAPKEVKEDKPIKKPASLERKLADMKERGVVPEPKRTKVEQPEPSQDRPRERRDDMHSFPKAPAYRETRDSLPKPEDNQPHPYYYREKPTQYPRRDEPVELTDEGEYYPTTIFVGDLTEDVTLPELETAFTRFGEIDSLRPVAGKNFVFIKFKNRDASLRAIVEMNGFVINNVRLRVHRAKVSKGRFGGRRRFEGGDYHHSEEQGDANNNNTNNTTASTTTNSEVPAEQRTVEYNPTKFVPKIPKMAITPELQEQQQLLSSRTLRNYEDL